MLALQTEKEDLCVNSEVKKTGGRKERETGISPNVAAIICHDVAVLAALYDDDFLLDDRKIVLCGVRHRRHVFIIINTALDANTGAVGGHLTCIFTALIAHFGL